MTSYAAGWPFFVDDQVNEDAMERLIDFVPAVWQHGRRLRPRYWSGEKLLLMDGADGHCLRRRLRRALLSGSVLVPAGPEPAADQSRDSAEHRQPIAFGRRPGQFRVTSLRPNGSSRPGMAGHLHEIPGGGWVGVRFICITTRVLRAAGAAAVLRAQSTAVADAALLRRPRQRHPEAVRRHGGRQLRMPLSRRRPRPYSILYI